MMRDSKIVTLSSDEHMTILTHETKAVYILMQRAFEAEALALSLAKALGEFMTFLEPMRFDRKSDDDRAIDLDRMGREILSSPVLARLREGR